MLTQRLEKFMSEEDISKLSGDELLLKYANAAAYDLASLRDELFAIIDECTEDDFEEYLKYQVTDNRNTEKTAKLYDADGEHGKAGILRGSIVEVRKDYQTAYSFLFGNIFELIVSSIARKISATPNHYRELLDEVETAASEKVQQWYKKPEEYIKTYLTKPSTELAEINSNKATQAINGDMIYPTPNGEAIMQAMKGVINKYNINVYKILSRAMQEFTARKSTIDEHMNIVRFSFLDFAARLGHDVYNADPDKARNARSNARRLLKKDLILLRIVGFTGDGNNSTDGIRDFKNRNYVYRAEIEHGQIVVGFSPDFALCLRQASSLTYYPACLDLIPATDATTFQLGLKLASYYNFDLKERQGTNDRLSVKVLLRVSGLKSYEEVLASKTRSWKTCIYNPLTTALNKLKDEYKLISSWEFCKAKAEPLTPAEESLIHEDYLFFESCYVRYEPKVLIDHTERRANKVEKRKKKTKKKDA